MSTSRPPVPGYRRHPLTIGCVQFDPKLKDLNGNIAKVRFLTKDIRPAKINLLVLPEMCLTGYMYDSRSDIDPFLENSRTGPTATLSSELARKCQCWVIAGYPERDSAIEDDGGVKDKAYNSAVVVSPDGSVVANYRKSFLYDTDKSWAEEGPGFSVLDLPSPLGRTVLGICMDMNPKDFLAPFSAYELATFAQSVRAELIVVPMNWLTPPIDPSDTEALNEFKSAGTGPEMSTLNYWAHRLTPLHDPAPGYEQKLSAEPANEVVFVACNRSGIEKGTEFVGSSCVMTLSSEPSGIDLIEAMGRREEGVMFSLVQ